MSLLGPSGISITPRARGRPPIGPHQRTDLYGMGPVLAAQKPPGKPPGKKILYFFIIIILLNFILNLLGVPNPEPSPKM